jgi:hypothetical protein
MKAILSFRFALYCILVLIFLYPVINYSQTRPMDAKRLSTLNYIHYDSMPDYLCTSNQMNYYTYQTENPDIIDYVIRHDTLVWGGEFGSGHSDSTYTIDYSSTISFENGQKHIQYSNSANETLNIIKDNLNRVINYEYVTNNQYDYLKVMSFYNSYGKLDSLISIYNTYYQIFRMTYDGLNFLNTITDTYYFNNYSNMSSIPITYPEGLPTNPVDINIDESLQYIRYRIMLYRMILDSHYQQNDYFGNPLVYQTSPDLLITCLGVNGGSSLAFDSEGYISSFHDYYERDHYTFTWESIVPNNDPIAPTPTLSMNIYPNPFRNNVNIELKDKTTAPSDISIYNIKGQLIRKWSNNRSSTVTWDGKDRFNRNVSSGVYVVKASKDGKSHTSKIVKY